MSPSGKMSGIANAQRQTAVGYAEGPSKVR